MLSQIKSGSQDNFVLLLEDLKSYGETNDYTIDLLKNMEHVERFIEIAKNEVNNLIENDTIFILLLNIG